MVEVIKYVSDQIDDPERLENELHRATANIKRLNL